MMFLTAVVAINQPGPELRCNYILDTATGIVYGLTRTYGENGQEMTGDGYPSLALYGPGATSHRVPYCILYGPPASSLWAVLSTLAEPVV